MTKAQLAQIETEVEHSQNLTAFELEAAARGRAQIEAGAYKTHAQMHESVQKTIARLKTEKNG
jgi:ribosomal protein L29